MRLDRLELSGFKSFPDRADVAFDPGVTAIVGPNGCGKSNLVDAITWVLGEQSAQEPARRAHGRRDLQRLRRAQGDRGRGGAPAAERRADRVRPAAGGPARRLVADELPVAAGAAVACRSRSTCPRVEHARGGDRAAAVPIGRERVPDRRRSLPAARRAGPADGRRRGREGLRGHRAGQDRADSEREADRAAPADRRSRGGHEVQVPAPGRGAQARRGAAEPHAHRRHRLRDREAARGAEAPGGQGAPIPAAARRAAPLGEGAVRPALPRAGAANRGRPWPAGRRQRAARATPWRRVADAERELGEARAALARADERLRELRERMHARQLDNDRREQQLAFNRQQVEALCARRWPKSRPSLRPSTRAGSRRAASSRPGATAASPRRGGARPRRPRGSPRPRKPAGLAPSGARGARARRRGGAGGAVRQPERAHDAAVRDRTGAGEPGPARGHARAARRGGRRPAHRGGSAAQPSSGGRVERLQATPVRPSRRRDARDTHEAPCSRRAPSAHAGHGGPCAPASGSWRRSRLGCVRSRNWTRTARATATRRGSSSPTRTPALAHHGSVADYLEADRAHERAARGAARRPPAVRGRRRPRGRARRAGVRPGA